MFRKFALIVVIGFLLFGCKKNPEVLYDEAETLESGYYKSYPLYLDEGDIIEVNFRVTSGDEVDVYLLSGIGFRMFQNLFKFDTLYIKAFDLTEYVLVTDTCPTIEKDELVKFEFSATTQCSVGIWYWDGESLIKKWDATSGSYEWKMAKKNPIIWAVYDYAWNSPTGTVKFYKRKSSTFSYISAGTQQETRELAYEYECTSTGTYYIVVENLDLPHLIDTEPTGAVNYTIKVIKK